MAGTSTGSGKYSLEKVMAEVLELKATQKKYAKQYSDAKSPSAAHKISLISDNAETIRPTDSANLEIQGQQLKQIQKAINRLETTMKEIARRTSENEKAIDDLEQYSWHNCLILHGCRDIPTKKSSYAEFESYVVEKLNFRLGLSHRIKTFDTDTCHILLSRKKDTTPIIIKFVRRSVRNSIYSSKKNLKSEEENAQKLSITESLTKRRLALIEEARNAFGFWNVWTFYGNVHCFLKNKMQVIDDFGDINKLLDS